MTRIQTLPESQKPKRPALAALLCAEKSKLQGLPYASEQALAAARADGWTGKKDKAFYFPASGSQPRLLLLGLGKAEEIDREALRRAAAAAARKARELKLREAVLYAADVPSGLDLAEAAKAMAEGIWLGLYRFQAYKSRPKDGEEEKDPSSFTLLCGGGKAQAAVAEAREVCRAVLMVRDWVNTPPSDLTPAGMVAQARRLTRLGARLRLRTFGRERLRAMGAGGILGVARGSAQPPFLVHLSYHPARPRRRVALVGKGVTFDSGGLSIKTGNYMNDMKCDMAGGATVLAACLAASRLRLPVEVHAVAPFVENMPSGTALKVDDVVRFMNGKTAEIANTDAEGRVILADALCYAGRLKPDLIIDVATLTGAAIAALGMNLTAILGDETLCAQLIAAGERCGEPMWRLPLPKAYRAHIDSKVADIKNVGNPGEAGTIAGAMFLKEFVDAKIPWVHCDIAGPAFLKKEEGVHPAGGTGTPLRSLMEFLKTL